MLQAVLDMPAAFTGKPGFRRLQPVQDVIRRSLKSGPDMPGQLWTTRALTSCQTRTAAALGQPFLQPLTQARGFPTSARLHTLV